MSFDTTIKAGDELIDLGSSDRAYLIRSKVYVDSLLASRSVDIGDAKRQFAAGGRGAPREWLRDVEKEIAWLGSVSQSIQARLVEIKAAHRPKGEA